MMPRGQPGRGHSRDRRQPTLAPRPARIRDAALRRLIAPRAAWCQPSESIGGLSEAIDPIDHALGAAPDLAEYDPSAPREPARSFSRFFAAAVPPAPANCRWSH
jgi:hypothetical protein